MNDQRKQQQKFKETLRKRANYYPQRDKTFIYKIITGCLRKQSDYNVLVHFQNVLFLKM